MKFSIDWLKELSNFKGSDGKLAELLSSHAFEAETEAATEFKDIITAKVKKIEKHPNADRLRVITLSDGKRQIGPVVCGAWNFNEGDVVALALPGAVIPHDQHDPEGKSFVLAKATIRGVESQGMICSGKELGISDDGQGIMILKSDTPLGQQFSSANDIALEVSVPANRPDLLSYLGIAREISALAGTSLTKSKAVPLSSIKGKGPKVTIRDPKLCEKYIAVSLDNVKVGDSPEDLKEKLSASGLRPINSIVDATNYAMLLTGQPLHAFDADKIQGEITIRRAKQDEKILTLDNVERKLSSKDLIIADDSGPIAIAGIIGGKNSAVSSGTQRIILEAANFNGINIRRTSRTLNLRTDASSRFEKSLPASFAQSGLEEALFLFKEIVGASISGATQAGAKSEKPTLIKLNAEDVSRLTGMSIESKKQKMILERFGFKVTGSKIFSVAVPAWRPDVNIWEDLAEEIIRFIGINEIPSSMPYLLPTTQLHHTIADHRERIADILARIGYSETYNYSFISDADANKWGISKPKLVEIANPLSSDQQYMRESLMINALKTVERNVFTAKSGRIFEIGNIYWSANGTPQEKLKLSMVSYGPTQQDVNLAGDFKVLCDYFNVPFKLRQTDNQSADVIVSHRAIGHLTVLPSTETYAVGLEIDLTEFAKHIKNKEYKKISRYPGKTLDVSLVVEKTMTWADIENFIMNLRQPLLEKLELFDVYRGSNIPQDKTSFSFRFYYMSPERTLTDKEVNEIHAKIIKELANKFKATVRT